MFKWISGRQGTGYDKLTLISSDFLKFDIHILRMKPGGYISKHIDPLHSEAIAQGYSSHHRLNIIIRKSKGGVFSSDTIPPISDKRVIRFRPDIDPHQVSEVVSGTRYVLSIGWLS